MSKFKVGVYSVCNENGWDMESEIVRAVDAEIEYVKFGEFERLTSVMGDLDGLIFSNIQITRDIMEKMPKCKVVVRHAKAVDNVDIEAAVEHGIAVCAVPDYNVEEVSDHALAFALMLARNIPFYHDRITNCGEWTIDSFPAPKGIGEMTIALAGFGQIAARFAQKAAPLFGRVMAYDPYMNRPLADIMGVEVAESLEEMLPQADVLSIHVPLMPETKGSFNRSVFAMMKPTAYFINTARGGLVNADDLCDCLEEGLIAGAATDVVENEPPNPDSRIFKVRNLIHTPHSAWYSQASLRKLRCMAAETVCSVLTGKKPRGLINPQVWGKIKEDK